MLHFSELHLDNVREILTSICKIYSIGSASFNGAKVFRFMAPNFRKVQAFALIHDQLLWRKKNPRKKIIRKKTHQKKNPQKNPPRAQIKSEQETFVTFRPLPWYMTSCFEEKKPPEKNPPEKKTTRKNPPEKNPTNFEEKNPHREQIKSEQKAFVLFRPLPWYMTSCFYFLVDSYDILWKTNTMFCR